MINSVPSVSTQKSDHLPGFMGESPALVVGGGGSARDRRVEDDYTVVLGVAGVRRREGGISQESGTRTRIEPDAVDVQSVGPTQPQLVLHRGLERATNEDVSNCVKKPSESAVRVYSLVGTGLIKPVGVEGPVGPGEEEADPARGVIGVHDAYGGRDLRIGDISARQGSGLVDHMPYKTNSVSFTTAKQKRSEI